MWSSYLIRLIFIFYFVQFTCQQAAKDDYLLVADRTSIFKFNVINNKTTLITRLHNDHNVKVFDYSFSDRLIFWLSKLDSSINVNNIDTGRKINLFKNQPNSLDYISIDWITKKIYWLANDPSRIEASDYNGNNTSLILMLSEQTPKCIALAPLDRLLFWSDAESSSINRISMNGDESTRIQIIADTRAYSIAIDHHLKKIYWNDITNNRIRSADFDGQHQRNIRSTFTPNVAFYNGNIFYSDFVDNVVVSFDPIGGKKKNLINNDGSPSLLAYFSQQNQPNDTQTSCLTNNGGCSNLCLLSSLTPFYSCSCPTSIPLSSDKKTCKSFSDQFLLVAFVDQISYISLETTDYLLQSTQIRKQERIRDVDFDPIEQRVYWIDENKVKSAFLNGTDQQLVTQCELEYERLRIDKINRNLYLVKNSLLISRDPDRHSRSSSSNFSIEVFSLNSKFKKTLIDNQIDNPRAIAVDEQNGFFYWSNWGNNPKIEKVSFDLKFRRKIITEHIAWPNGIVIDQDLKRLYWCDAKFYTIEYSDLDGLNRKTLIELSVPLLDLTLMGDYIYWVDTMKDQIGRVHKITGEHKLITNPNQKESKIMGFSVVSNLNDDRSNNQHHANTRSSCSQISLNQNLCACSDGYLLLNDNITCQLGNDTCKLNNGDCQHHCNQIIGNYYKCSCPDGFALDYNQKTCTVVKRILPTEVYNACDQSPRPCSHDCISISGAAHCRCPSEMTLDKTGRTCLSLTTTESNVTDELKEPATNQKDFRTVTSIVLVVLLSILMVSIIVLTIRCAIKKNKESKFQNSKESIIKSSHTDQRPMNYRQSRSNEDYSIQGDRSLGVGASIQDENRHLIDLETSDNMSSVSKWQHRIPKYDSQSNLNFRSTHLADLDDLETNYSSINNLDEISNMDMMTNANSTRFVPPPTPLLRGEYDEFLNQHDDRIYNHNLITTSESNLKNDLILRDYMLNNYCSALDESFSQVSAPTYPMHNPPNSLSSSINNLTNFKNYDNI